MNARMIDFVYITRARAIESGMTHEGRLYGVPAWMALSGENEVMASPKVPLLHAWCLLADSLLECATYFISSDRAIESPITLSSRIQG